MNNSRCGFYGRVEFWDGNFEKLIISTIISLWINNNHWKIFVMWWDKNEVLNSNVPMVLFIKRNYCNNVSLHKLSLPNWLFFQEFFIDSWCKHRERRSSTNLDLGKKGKRSTTRKGERKKKKTIISKHPACNGARIRNKITTINREMGVTYFGWTLGAAGNGRCNFHKMAVAALASTPSSHLPRLLHEEPRSKK